MKYQLTGNPFVDTGIFAMQAHASTEHGNKAVDDLTPEVVTDVMNDKDGFGRWLAKSNRQLNSFFMVCTNSALVNSSTNKKLYKTGQRGFLDEEDTGWKDYLETLKRLHDELRSEPDVDAPVCESCGERPATKVLSRVGRDFFPLAGSLGNDAQALPAGSRAPRVCPLCLIAIQWLPLGGIMLSGRLACLQFTEPMLSQHFVENTYRKIRERLDQSPISQKVLVPGSGEGATSTAQVLIDMMRQLQKDRNDPGYKLSKDVTLNIWAFSNSGASPDCEVIEIHNPALQFLWEAAQLHYTEISDLLKGEDSKKSATHLLSAIERGSDYGGFYPRKSGKSVTKPASLALYELYQTRILKRSRVALEAARNLATLIYERLTSGDKKEQKFLAQILKENPRWVKDRQVRVDLRKQIAAFAEEGHFSFAQYAHLFPAANLEGIENLTPDNASKVWQEKGAAARPTIHGWAAFWFYLHHAENGTLKTDSQTATQTTDMKEDVAMFTNPEIQRFAQDVFAMQLEHRGGEDRKRGLTYVKRYIVDGFTRGKITNATLRNWFSLLAETKPEGYANKDFDALCRDETGREAINEMRFQMRLEIANLYRNAIQKKI